MSEDLHKKIAALKQTLHVLSEENIQLAEKAEDSMLLGLISESAQNASHGGEILEKTLERIAILKSLPFACCAEIRGDRIKVIASYSSYSSNDTAPLFFDVKQPILQDLKDGPVIVRLGVELHSSFTNNNTFLCHAALIPFTSQAFPSGIFIFMVGNGEDNRLKTILPLLSRAVEITESRFDNLVLLQALTETNKNLESLVEKRTNDLITTNKQLRVEMLERQASQQALQESHHTLNTVLDSVDAMIYAVDLNSGKILFMNKRLQDELDADWTGKCFSELFHFDQEKNIQEYREKFSSAIDAPQPPVVWQSQSRTSGRWFVISDRAVKWSDGSDAMLRIATDITLVKEMENKLQHTHKMEAIGTLAGGIAHDFNNLLMGIQGRASLISIDVQTDHPVLEHVKSIEEHVQSAASLTKQILGFARGGKYSVKPVDINELVIKNCEMFARTRKELTLRTRLHNTSLIAKVDRGQIEQVLLNLLINGWQALQHGGELRVATHTVKLEEQALKLYGLTPGTYHCIEVQDDGIGMNEATRQRVFDPFFTTKEKQRGTGLGLASAYGIIRNHNGIITVESTLNKGSTFKVFLPASKEQIDVVPEEQTHSTEGKGTILLVDDEKMICEVGQQMLERLGYTVVIARDGQQAINIVQQNGQEIDLVILDLIMPGMDGGETFEALVNIKPDLPVLLSSGYSKVGYAKTVVAKGCSGFLQKPFNLRELAHAVNKSLENPNHMIK